MDRITKELKKLSISEKKILKQIITKIKQRDFNQLDIKKLKSRKDIFRVRKGRIRIIFKKDNNKINLLTIERRSENTYRI